MNLNDMLQEQGIDPQQVLVLRHRPQERELNRVLPWLAAERPDVFNAYQQTQTEKLEKENEGLRIHRVILGALAGKALFVGLYTIGASKPLTLRILAGSGYIEMKAFGMKGPSGDRSTVDWFDLTLMDFYASWKGKLVVGWPPPELVMVAPGSQESDTRRRPRRQRARCSDAAVGRDVIHLG